MFFRSSFLFAAFIAAAASQSLYALTVDNYNSLRNRVFFAGDESSFQGLNPGYRLTLTLEEGKTCDLEVLEIKKEQLIADSSLCRFKKDIKPGQQAAKAGSSETLPTEAAAPNAASNEEPTTPPVPATSPSTSRFAIDLGITYSTDKKFDTKGRLDPFGTKFSGSFNSEPAAGALLGFTYKKAEELPWFVSGGIQIDLPRKVKSQSISVGNASTMADYQNSSVKMTYVAIYGSFAYEILDPVYVVGGMGIASLGISGFSPEIKSSGGLQLHAGIGSHFFNEHIFLEALARYQSTSARRDLGPNIVKYERIDALGALVTLRYSFY